ncbi:MAG: mechanosensitive ion channel [Leptolyngbyaceae cyanobacterium SM2_3_12]|nr:mechanosensitive ion channel [Leptolyngbyaceae cyanobacterium SM2_3_12]
MALENPVVNVTTQKTEAGQPKIYVNGQYLMTVTPADANLQGMTTAGLVESLTSSIDDAGLVEKLNLRITQLRDTAGQLITIPTSDITRMANYSLHWSQADLKIPVHLQRRH